MKRILKPVIPLVVAAAVAGCGSAASSSSSSSASSNSAAIASGNFVKGPTGPEGVPLESGPGLAPASTTTPGTPVDGIQCAPLEQLAYHIHAHLQVYVNGSPRALPAAIGILHPVFQQTAEGPFYGAGAGGCFYWLHTHSTDGIIHIESPTQRIYTLGDFFNEWRQPLGPDQVAANKGTVVAIVNGSLWPGNPRTIPLTPHASIELAVGGAVPQFHVVNWGATQL
jgi:hypothetical protein